MRNSSLRFSWRSCRFWAGGGQAGAAAAAGTPSSIDCDWRQAKFSTFSMKSLLTIACEARRLISLSLPYRLCAGSGLSTTSSSPSESSETSMHESSLSRRESSLSSSVVVAPSARAASRSRRSASEEKAWMRWREARVASTRFSSCSSSVWRRLTEVEETRRFCEVERDLTRLLRLMRFTFVLTDLRADVGRRSSPTLAESGMGGISSSEDWLSTSAMLTEGVLCVTAALEAVLPRENGNLLEVPVEFDLAALVESLEEERSRFFVFRLGDECVAVFSDAANAERGERRGERLFLRLAASFSSFAPFLALPLGESESSACRPSECVRERGEMSCMNAASLPLSFSSAALSSISGAVTSGMPREGTEVPAEDAIFSSFCSGPPWVHVRGERLIGKALRFLGKSRSANADLFADRRFFDLLLPPLLFCTEHCRARRRSSRA
mmetsp:Transcript_1373/g.4932  ORF Transcript_1373/g.4932 Transcript_1373/m.4932 type:complete len:439 (+) Transcript_1373:1958-3274(+)